MKQVKLMELKLQNFKGIKEFVLSLDGKSAGVYAENGKGKTTLFDAFLWNLFGKDSNDRTDFEIKELDENGNVKQHGLEHSVEVVFEINGTEIISLKRVYAEKWTKKRGSRKATFTGHTTDYFVDGVPVKQKEYNEKVNGIVSEDAFKLLTNPKYFNEKLNWQKRRDLLLEIAGDLTDLEVAEGDKDLEAFVSKLNGRLIEDHIKVIKSKQKEINEELEKIPVRIDELNLNMPDVKGLSKEAVQSQIDYINEQIAVVQENINNINNGGEISKKKKALAEIDLEIAKIRAEHSQKGLDKKYSLKAGIQEAESNVSLIESQRKSNNREIERSLNRLTELETELKDLRNQYKEIKAREFTHEENCTCPTCGQQLPEEQLEQARQKALESFNQRKAEEIKRNIAQGKSKKEQADSIKADIEKIEKKNLNIAKEIEKNVRKAEHLKAELKEIEESISDVTESTEFIAKMREKAEIEKEIVQIQDNMNEAIRVQKVHIAEYEEQRKEQQDAMNKLNIAEQYEGRIKELMEQEKVLSAEYTEWEKDLFLAETFIKTKVDKLEGRINNLFQHARFKLFETQINGGIKETCVTMYEGIPYDKGLNNSAQINIGLDIIRVLNKHYETYLPIYVDNAEAVTKLFEVDTQLIQLIVSEEHKELTVKKGEF